MTFPKNSRPSTSAPDLGELLRMHLQHESRSSAPDNAAEESNPLLYSGLHSFTAASEQVRMQRQQSSVPGNAESDNISSSNGLRSFTAIDRASHPSTTRTRSLDTLRSILNCAIAVIDDDDEELEDSVISSRHDDFNPQQ
jgi:hypothetical protein